MKKGRQNRLGAEFAFYGLLFMFLAGATCVYGSMNNVWNRPWGGWAPIYLAKTGIEIVASGFAIFYMLVALTYRKPAAVHGATKLAKRHPRWAIAYLCCGDMDDAALHSIVECGARYSAYLVLHDDSASRRSRARVDSSVKALEARYGVSIRILRRHHRTGGKPGAVNNVVENLPSDIEFLLLCDNDSFLPQNDFMDQAFSYFENPKVAIVQFRNSGYVSASDSKGYRTLSQSVDFYDAFVTFMDRFGWSPFLGHNALLRVSVIKEVGGFTPGQLADDIDYSVKLRLHGYEIRYAREIAAGERHPLTYGSLRKRTQKWTYGCTQILMRWSWAVATSRQLSPADKISFFMTVGYYHFQLLLLAYLFIFYCCLPFHDREMGRLLHLMVSAGLILFFTFMPSITFFWRNGRLLDWPKAALYWGFTYGSQDFVMLRAALNCLIRRPLEWSPTNGSFTTQRMGHFLPEILFALLILVIATIQQPVLLLLPTTVLFAGKFLVAPCLGALVFDEGGVDMNHRNACAVTSDHSPPLLTDQSRT